MCARATRFGANLCLARLMSMMSCHPIGCALSSAQPCPSRGWVPASQLGSEDLPERQGRRPARRCAYPPAHRCHSSPAGCELSTVSHVCFMLTVRRRRAPPPTAPLLPPPSPHLRRIYRVCSRVWAVVLGRLRARALCNVCVPLEGPAGLWAASGGQKGRGVRSFRLPRSRWTWAGPLGRLGRLGTRLGRSELHSRACL